MGAARACSRSDPPSCQHAAGPVRSQRPLQGAEHRRGRHLAGRGKDTGTYGLWHSTDTGASFTRQANVDRADTIGFGKSAPGSSYPALHSSARIGGVCGIFRSDDAGAHWIRINDGSHQWGWTGSTITGAPGK